MSNQAPTSSENSSITQPQAADSHSAVLVTGANGHLGQRMVPELATRQPVIAVVRSASAAASLQAIVDAQAAEVASKISIVQLQYTDVSGLREVAQTCSQAIHLAGILKESPWSTYKQAHEDTTQALLTALKGTPVGRIQYLSIVGSQPNSANECLASKGRAEAMLLDSDIPTLVMQVPMVLGEGDYAAAALNAQARRTINLVFAVTARDQPLYAGDVVKALISGLDLPAKCNQRLTLAGPEAINKRELIKRAAALLGQQTRVIGLPGSLATGLARVFEMVSKSPPVTVPMMEILHHDDNYNSEPACELLGLTLTPLDSMLENVLIRVPKIAV